LNEVDSLRRCLQAARRDYAPTSVEIVVVDGGSTDGTCGVVPEEVKLIRAPRGRAVQMNHGAAASSGEVLVFCHADTELPEKWRECIMEILKSPGVSGGAFQTAYRPARGFLHLLNHLKLPGWMWFAVHGDRAQFMRREMFTEVGGFREIPLMEDVEMARALHHRGRLAMCSRRVSTSSRRYLESGPLRQYGLVIWLMFRYLILGATPHEIARAYKSSREEDLASLPRSYGIGGRYEQGKGP
jgi:rSAM/selenodomain-associated transferase 2